ncbi:MAG TPA: YdbL family protein [Spongiibacteraceae bacterium]|nr:YdbL family protein [Spongiibacteraceae bacterium]
MRTLLRVIFLAGGLLAAQFSFALALDEAKQQGLVGEQPTGYLGIVGKATPDVQALVNDINQKRRAAYEGIAKRNGTDITTVEQLAGKKAIDNTPTGQFVKMPEGNWMRVK